MEPLHTLSATRAKALLDAGEVSSVALVQALLARIDRYDGAVRAFTERLDEQALAQARAADQARSRGERGGALQGLPITVKESIEITGSASTLGIPARVGARATRDAAVVAEARRQGAIVIGRTNVPQLLLSFECRNPVFGQCVNPRKASHSPGGSSGGEAAALAYGASMLGIGTDIGGSIRLPAHFAGVVGFKPTQDRWPNRGLVAGIPGQEAIRSQCGPMARSVADVSMLLRALDPTAMSREDGRVPPLPVGDPARVSLRGLRVGLIEHDGLLAPSRANLRALRRAAQVLEIAGVEVIPYQIPGVPEAIGEYLAALSADGAATARRMLAGAPVDSTLQSLFLATRIPSPVRALAARGLKAAGQPLTGIVLDAVGDRSVSEFWRLVYALRSRRAAVEQDLSDRGIDALILPPFATPAVPHHFGDRFAQAASYTMIFNLLHWPAGVVPVSTVTESECDREPSLDAVVRRAREIDRRSVGLPVGVQVAAPAWRDELCLALMAEIERGVASDADRPAAVVDP
jgi:fatty acid amide hydrolase